jgi:hypothetical protein
MRKIDSEKIGYEIGKVLAAAAVLSLGAFMVGDAIITFTKGIFNFPRVLEAVGGLYIGYAVIFRKKHE